MVEKTIQLDINEDQIGLFVGGKGSCIRKFIIGKTKGIITKDFEGEGGPDLNGIFCKIDVDDGKVSAQLKANCEDHLKVLEESVLKHQEVTLKKKDKKDIKNNGFTTKYVFKTSMDHHIIPKFIGSRGNNINELKSNITLSDPNLENEKVRINICEDKRIRMQRLHFEHLKTSCESEQKVLITVEMNTKNREESLKVVRDSVSQSVEKANVVNHSYHGNPVYDTVDDSSGFQPQNDEGSMLDNPFSDQ